MDANEIGNVAITQKIDLVKQKFELAKKLQKEDKSRKAIEKYSEILAIQPKFVPALNQLGKLYEAEQKFDLTADCYQKVVELDPENSFCYARLGRAMMGLKNFAASISAYQKAIALKPDSSAWVYRELGDALLKDGQAKKAIAAYRQALKHQPSNPDNIRRKLDKALNLAQENPIRKIALQVQKEAPYTGGPIQFFEMVGRDTIITLLQNGLRPDHNILDFGCGAVRLGYWIIRLMEKGNYYGIEPVNAMLKTGKKYTLGQELIDLKHPQFANNEDSDFSVFGVQFDFVVARSIFTHMTPAMLRRTLKSFRENSTANGVMLASYWPLESSQKGEIGDDLPLTDARFIRVVKYNLDTIQSWSAEFDLKVSEFRINPLINEQVWLKFERLSE